jgi:estrogen-related receptor beta like 1
MILLWENSLERLKLLNYEKEYCERFNKKQFNRVHFVYPSSNTSHQFDEFVSLCSWMCGEITKKKDTFKPDELDDPNTVINKLMLVLRQFDFRSTFSAQKLKNANGDAVCQVLDFLSEKLLGTTEFVWKSPTYQNPGDVSGND